jgi:catechol 2,3-dioxygenase-like lactoylglutathione lyase family enzyme
MGDAQMTRAFVTKSRLGLSAVIAAAFFAAAARAQTPPMPSPAAPAPALSLMASVVPSSDLGRSIAFYENGLGLKAAERLDTANATEAPLLFPGGGSILMLVKSKTDGAPLPVRGMYNRVVLSVPDVKALAARMEAAGYPLKRAPVAQAQHHVIVAIAEDPDGNMLELVQR